MTNQMQLLADVRIGRSMFKLTIPVFFGMLVMTLYNVVDTIFIGRYVGALGIAGLSIVFPIQMLAMGIGQMAGMGGASLVSRSLGAGDDDRARRTLGNSISSLVFLSVVVMTVGEISVDFWLRLFGASDNILPYAHEYMVVILVGMVFQTLTMALNGLVRSEGNSRAAMIGVIIGAGSNIVLDALFIIFLGCGVAGAAWATIIAMLVSTLYFVWYYLSGKSHFKLKPRDLVFDFSILKPIYAIGSASLIKTMGSTMSVIIINRQLGYYGGDLAISAFGIINRLLMFAIMPGIVISQGLQPILGYNYGAKRFKLALKAISIAAVWATVFSVLSFMLLHFLPHVFIRVFTADQQLIDVTVHAAKRIFFFLYMVGISFVGMMSFQALGKAVQALITSATRPALFLIPLVLIFSHYWGVDGVWWGFATTELLTVILVIVMLVPQLRSFHREVLKTALEKRDSDGQSIQFPFNEKISVPKLPVQNRNTLKQN